MIEEIKKMFEEPRHKKLYFRVPDDHVFSPEVPSIVIKPERSYFQIRLCELYLRNEREYWSGYIPMEIVVSDFLYDGKNECIPFFVGNQILGEIETHLDGQFVDFRNTRVAGPVPYMGDDVGIFVGLFRLKVSDLLENLFNLLGTITGAFDASILSRYLEIAKPLTQGFSDFFRGQKNDLRFGVRDVFSDQQDGQQQFRQGYLVYVNCPEQMASSEELWVRENRLLKGKSRDKAKSFDSYDYCLLKIEHLETRNDYSKLPFYEIWKETRNLIVDGNMEKANWKRIEMLQSIANSPDLTEEHREQLIAAFEVKFLNIAAQNTDKERKRAGTNTHRGRSVSENPGISLQMAADIADQGNYEDTIVQRLLDLSESWELVTEPEKDEEEPISETINTQLAVLKRIDIGQKPNPIAFADILTKAALYRS